MIQKWRAISYWGRWWIKLAIWGRWWIKLAIFVFTIYFGYDLYGRWAWWNFQSSYAANGVSFDLESHLREIPPENDYFESPTLSSWINSTDPALVSQLTEWPKGTEYSDNFDRHANGWHEGTITPLREYLMSSPTAMSDAKVVEKLRMVMAPSDGAFTRLISDSDRTGVRWKSEPPNIKGIPEFLKILGVRVRVHLQSGNGERALQELIAGIRLAQRIRDSNTFDSLRGQHFALAHICDATWDGLHSRAWNHAQLTRLLKEFRQVKITKDMSSIGIHELALTADSMEKLGPDRFAGIKGVTGWHSYWFSQMKGSLIKFSKPSRELDDLKTAGVCFFNSLMPKGHRQLGLKKYGEYLGVTMIGEPNSISTEFEISRSDRSEKKYGWGSRLTFLGVWGPTLSGKGEYILSLQQFLDFAILSCELELHLKKNGQAPKSIDSLFEVPRDRFCPHLPIRYERTGLTSYRLIACGKDRVDNKGAMSMDPFFEIKAVKK